MDQKTPLVTLAGSTFNCPCHACAFFHTALSEDEAGKVDMQFAPTGLVVTFDLPLPTGIAA